MKRLILFSLLKQEIGLAFDSLNLPEYTAIDVRISRPNMEVGEHVTTHRYLYLNYIFSAY